MADHQEANSDVFLSFRGEDTRTGFTDHLHTALIDSGICAFRDDEGIRRGRDIGEEIKKAIQESKASIVVFSKDYASSRWCLDELVMIMRRKRSDGYVVVPIFYEVGRCEVAEQMGRYQDAFAKHEEMFKNEVEKVEQWRAVLGEAAELEGLSLNDGSEAEFVKEIVAEIRGQLNRNQLWCYSPAVPRHLFSGPHTGKKPFFFCNFLKRGQAFG